MADRFAGLGPYDIARIVLTENSDGPRYIVIPETLSGHGCCFGWSVVDQLAKGADKDPPDPLCECADEDAANRIAAALNAAGGCHEQG